ncbi:hypothetical protein F5X68DRAFT_246632 [Plectosphaerella plurivora]|uniref:F-box domain-containing protein n=1 Tax=Plectosphaerella plurivora TaxID=936078 RepID=A0A9P9A7D7_9PEZI|nr:hypothetical protein F5X68DRAFT_246632 [Plectosphaerella plurivora]
MTIPHLPMEVWDMIIGFLATAPDTEFPWNGPGGFESLTNARLVSRRWATTVDRHLFKVIHLKHSTPPNNAGNGPLGSAQNVAEQEAVFERWTKLCTIPIARQTARLVIINSAPMNVLDDVLRNVWSEWSRYFNNGFFSGFENAVKRISNWQLPNLDAVEIHFSDKCQGEFAQGLDVRHTPDIESATARLNTLMLVLNAILSRNRKKGIKPITYLGLKNFQNMPLDYVPTRRLRAVLQGIQHLHFHIAVDYREHRDSILYSWERLGFEPYLQSELLPTAAGHLTTLTLSFNDEWATMPGYFDGSGLDYPCLETLHLDLFVISHDNHLDWVLRIPKLTSLYFTETRIMTLASERLPWGSYGIQLQDTNQAVFSYPGRWSYLFDRIRLELDKLRDFRISWADPGVFDGTKTPWTTLPRPTIQTDFVDRYVVFEFMTLPVPWTYQKNGGFLNFGDNDADPNHGRIEEWPNSRHAKIPNPAMVHWVEDDRALEELRETTKARQPI